MWPKISANRFQELIAAITTLEEEEAEGLIVLSRRLGIPVWAAYALTSED